MLCEADFRRPQGLERLVAAIQDQSLPPMRLMEVCGTHTMALARTGVRQLLPPQVKLISGPGCPVCVTPANVMDEVLRIAALPGVTLTTYGDLMRVPGSKPGFDLRRQKALGADIQVVYSPMDALELAKAHPEQQVVFLGVGFETTAPGTALAVLEAQRQGLKNFSLLCLLKATPPALRALLSQEDFGVDGFLCPGHVATILGAEAFSFLPQEYQKPAVVAGFEAGDLVAALHLLITQVKDHTPKLENEYTRAVSQEGNQMAQGVMAQVLDPKDDTWRGLGDIPSSGFGLKPEFAAYDAAARFGFSPAPQTAPSPCRCGDVICGRIGPRECPLFGTVCSPDNPVGPCMVSGEGACAAAYLYGRE